MLRWRLLLGTVLVAALVGLCALDHRAASHGLWLAPALVLFGVLGTREILDLEVAAGLRPAGWAVYLGNLLVLASPWAPLVARWWVGTAPGGWPPGELPAQGFPDSWLAVSLASAMILAFVGEMVRYEKPGGATANLAASVLAVVYVGVLLACVVHLRLQWGVAALGSLLVVVKMGDTGAYVVGRWIGRHKLAPRLSPGKTVEGALGALAFALASSWATFQWLVPLVPPDGVGAASGDPPWWGWIVFGVGVGGLGMLGDLAESLLKRDGAQKDSSRWLPGFGGVLDVLDSVLLGAPAAYGCWYLGLVG
jgi:phosphatidate cytidylyltransferase